MEWLQQNFTKYPEMAVFLALGIGYWIGNPKIRGFSLGGATGSLLAGIVIGAFFKVPVTSMAKSVVFLLFMFAIGYSVGPQFFKTMKGDGWRFAVLGAFVPVVGLIATYSVARVLHLDAGFAGGLVSGALTQSAAMGTASDAIQSLSLPDDLKHKLIGRVAVGDALCYVFGAFGVIYSCTLLGPKLLGINLKTEAEKLEAQYGIKRTKHGIASAWRAFELRAYRLQTGTRAAGKTVAETEKLVANARVFVQRIRRGQELIEATPDTVLQAGDIVAVAGRREVLVEILGANLQEVEDRELLDMPAASYEVFVSSKQVVGRTIEDLARDDPVRSVFLRKLTRGGLDIPIGTQTVIERGDVVTLVGPEDAVERGAKIFGQTIRPSDVTDFVVVGLAICVGALVGAVLAFKVGTVRISLGTTVGTLLAGILTGHIRSVRPLFGRVPDGAVSFMQSFGLASFVAMVGLGAGPEFLPAIKEAGIGLLIGGMFVTMIPQIAGLYFGRYVLRVNPLLLLGGMSGAQTFTAGLAAVQEKSGSPIAVLGYSGAVPVAQVLLTTWGSVIVLLMSR
jgi:putative transport protein